MYMSAKNLEYIGIIFICWFVLFYINNTLINCMLVYLLTKTFSVVPNNIYLVRNPLQRFYKETVLLMNTIYYHFTKYGQKDEIDTRPGSSKENPIDLTNDEDDSNLSGSNFSMESDISNKVVSDVIDEVINNGSFPSVKKIVNSTDDSKSKHIFSSSVRYKND